MKPATLFAPLLGLLVISGVILSKEWVLHDGQELYLKLAPKDPRSLIQGDYMRLDYELTRKVPLDDLDDSGLLVLTLDAQGVGSFRRLDNEQALAANELKLAYRNYHGVKLGAESYLFQEGLAECYQQAQYARLKVSSSGSSLLIGLLDDQLKPVGNQLEHSRWFTTMPNNCD
ncbi:GDYXXLXY domain-containing protein [Aestuariirhabdus sp. Z084]|uniref:GDYXXLXY domain-containing protein n=1 Tax=Aestuariirhabdus haliotis TaxID=2918751 RepID=UPI00201B3599|nr:GDYXXLXY domain-containing protein [Aestuariirhabdus haliotis]MCL6414655.1 GDYXXLXY domain-containing protein [Aestuariirhabdus haliotis]MCL6418363.1 GDYXXLXY domain-containing protein [Aestuariirhabdus haliotis]